MAKVIASTKIFLTNSLITWLIPIAIIVVWQIAVQSGWLSTRIMPAPWDVLNAGITLAKSGELTRHFLASLERAVLGLLIGGLSTGFVLAVFMANAGGAWDNAKKYVEEGNFGGKGSDNHKATIVGDTVGDPFKDTSGPSLNILIKLMSMVSIVMAGLTVTFSLF